MANKNRSSVILMVARITRIAAALIMADSIQLLSQIVGCCEHTRFLIFSVTRRSRTDVVHLLTHSLTECLMVSIDLTDVTLVSDDSFRRLGTWVTHDHLSSVIESVRPS